MKYIVENSHAANEKLQDQRKSLQYIGRSRGMDLRLERAQER